MFGRLIVALLIIGAAAVVTMERETAEAADMTATLAEAKHGDAEDRAQSWEKRARDAEAQLGELQAKATWLESALVTAKHEKELALLTLEVKTREPSVRGGLTVAQVMAVVRDNTTTTTPCFARAPERGPAVTMKWVIGPNGRVVSVVNDGVPEGFDVVIDCLAEEVSTWRFPANGEGLTLAQLSWITAAPAY